MQVMVLVLIHLYDAPSLDYFVKNLLGKEPPPNYKLETKTDPRNGGQLAFLTFHRALDCFGLPTNSILFRVSAGNPRNDEGNNKQTETRSPAKIIN
jgi:hypothetical protein